MAVCVVGLGKIGLPLAVQYASRGLKVIGCDINPQLVQLVNRGRTGKGVEEGLSKGLREVVSEGLLVATTDVVSAVRKSEVIIIIVPLIIDEKKRMDYTSIEAATGAVAKGLQKGSLIIFETTLPVGDTRGRFGPLLEEGSGLKMGEGFHLAYSPERVYVGRIFADLKRYPKVVGGVDERSTELAVDFYSRALEAEILPVANCETAELVKLMETTYRDVNIALANEFATYAAQHGIDVMEAIEAANTQPFSHIHRPGIGVGGHCIPVYPYFLMNDFLDFRLVRLAREINDGMPEYAVEIIEREMGGLKDKNILILGLAYRENVPEVAFTAAVSLIEGLNRCGARVFAHDPFFSLEEIQEFGAIGCDLEKLPEMEGIILQSYHDQYRDLDFSICKNCTVILDGRNVLSKKEIEGLGIRYIGVGR